MANAILNIGQTGGQINVSTAAAPATPAAGVVTLYAGTDKALHALNADGLDVTIATGVASPITVQQVDSLVSTGIGATATAGGSIAIGATASSTAANSVVIGNTACATAINSVAIGNTAITICQDTIAIGQNGLSCICEGVAIGKGAFARKPNIGDVGSAVVIGAGACTTAGAFGGAVAIGPGACAHTYNSVAVGSGAGASNESAIAIGVGSKASGLHSISMSRLSCATQTGAVALGCASCAIHTGAVALGPAITTIRTNTTHVNSLIAFGQAASIANTIGATSGTVTVDFDNSNVQTLTLTENITTLTKSNPIDGGVYTLFLTQGGSGGYTVDFGADVKFAGGAAPTLSTAIGATDAVSLVYIAGVTGYFGNANLNFA